MLNMSGVCSFLIQGAASIVTTLSLSPADGDDFDTVLGQVMAMEMIQRQQCDEDFWLTENTLSIYCGGLAHRAFNSVALKSGRVTSFIFKSERPSINSSSFGSRYVGTMDMYDMALQGKNFLDWQQNWCPLRRDAETVWHLVWAGYPRHHPKVQRAMAAVRERELALILAKH